MVQIHTDLSDITGNWKQSGKLNCMALPHSLISELRTSFQHTRRYESIISTGNEISILANMINIPCYYHLYLKQNYHVFVLTIICSCFFCFFFFLADRSQPNRFKFSLNGLSKVIKAIKNQSISIMKINHNFTVISWISKCIFYQKLIGIALSDVFYINWTH